MVPVSDSVANLTYFIGSFSSSNISCNSRRYAVAASYLYATGRHSQGVVRVMMCVLFETGISATSAQ